MRAFVFPICVCSPQTPLCLIISSLCVLFSSPICVCCPQIPLCVPISRECVLFFFLICVYCFKTPFVFSSLGSVSFYPPSWFIVLTNTPLFVPSCLGSVCLPFIFSIRHAHSCLPLLSRLYVFSFSFINTDVSPFWMKPYMQIWDHGLFGAWKHNQAKVLHTNNVEFHAESKDKWRFLPSFTHVNILTISCLLKIEGCSAIEPNGHGIVWGVESGDLTPYIIYIFSWEI